MSSCSGRFYRKSPENQETVTGLAQNKFNCKDSQQGNSWTTLTRCSLISLLQPFVARWVATQQQLGVSALLKGTLMAVFLLSRGVFLFSSSNSNLSQLLWGFKPFADLLVITHFFLQAEAALYQLTKPIRHPPPPILVFKFVPNI